MSPIVILCVEDEAEVRDAVLRDLAPFSSVFRIEAAEDVEDARDILKECGESGEQLGLVLCDHLMPGTRGVEFLVELQKDARYVTARKVLITGQAGLEDTVTAVNEADLHHYIAKPWNADELQQVVRDQLTEYVIANEDDLTPYVAVLDGTRLMEKIAERASDR